MKDFPFPLKYKCKAGTSDIKLKFGMYYGVPTHKECGLPVSTLGIIQGGIHSQGVHAIYAQEVRDMESSFCWTTTKTCTCCNKAFSNGASAINHMRAHYQIVLVCPFCGMHGSHSYFSIREHMKKCKEMYQNLLEGSDAETGLYEPCFCKGDTHLPKKGLASPTPFTYKLKEGRVNTKTIKQLISEFHTRAEKEVTAIHKAHLLHKRQNAQAPDDDPKKSSCAAETDAEETPKKKWIKSSPSTNKPPPSAAIGRAPKGTGIDKVKGLDNDELDYNNDVGSEDTGGDPVQILEPSQNDKTQDSEKASDEQHCHQVMGLLDIQVTAILIARSPEVDPEVNLKVGHLMGPAAPLLLATESILMTESILVTGSVMETEVETRATDLIVDPTTLLRTMTGTVPTMTGTMMTGFATLTAGNIAGVDTGLFPVGSHLLQGLMTTAQLT